MRQGEYRGTLFPYPEVVPATTYSASPMCRTMPGFSAGIKAKVGEASGRSVGGASAESLCASVSRSSDMTLAYAGPSAGGEGTLSRHRLLPVFLIQRRTSDGACPFGIAALNVHLGRYTCGWVNSRGFRFDVFWGVRARALLRPLQRQSRTRCRRER